MPTVAEWIKILQEQPQDLPVCFHDSEEGMVLLDGCHIETVPAVSWGNSKESYAERAARGKPALFLNMGCYAPEGLFPKE